MERLQKGQATKKSGKGNHHGILEMCRILNRQEPGHEEEARADFSGSARSQGHQTGRMLVEYESFMRYFHPVPVTMLNLIQNIAKTLINSRSCRGLKNSFKELLLAIFSIAFFYEWLCS